MDIFAAPTYREFVSESIKPKSGHSWGSVKRLAEVLKCHSTYVSQIIKGKSDMSLEQAVAFCDSLGLKPDEADHFLDLLNRDKAGSKQSRTYFQSRIDRRLKERRDLKARLTATDGLSLDLGVRYYNGWLPQVVHICTQTKGGDTAEGIARMLRLDLQKVEEILDELTEIGLIEFVEGKIRCLKDSVFIDKDSPLITRFHSNWRMRTVHEMLTSVKPSGTHYSSVLTMSADTARKLQELIFQHIRETRELVLPSPSEHVYSFCLDFYPITDAPDLNVNN